MITITRKTPGGEVSASWTPGLSADQVDDIIRRAEGFGSPADSNMLRLQRLAVMAGVSVTSSEYMAPELIEARIGDAISNGVQAWRAAERSEKRLQTATAELREIGNIADRVIESDGSLPPAGRVAELGEEIEHLRGCVAKHKADNEKLTALVEAIGGLMKSEAGGVPAEIRDLITKHNAPPLTLDTATGADLDVIALRDFRETRQPGMTDEQLRENCIPF